MTAESAVAGDVERKHIPRCDARDGGYCFDSWCQCWCHDLDRHADALATLAGVVRHAFIGEAR